MVLRQCAGWHRTMPITHQTLFLRDMRYELILEPMKGTPTPLRRLAIILKRLGRAYGFRCISAKELPRVNSAEGKADAS